MANKILLVDDEPTILFAMERYFRTLGYEVRVARTLAEAKIQLENQAFELLITDLRLRPPDGNEGLAIVAFARNHSPDTRIILLSAYVNQDTENRAVQSGVDALLKKPKPLDHIAQIAARLLWDSRKSKKAPCASGI